jgi:hypothetical protein
LLIVNLQSNCEFADPAGEKTILKLKKPLRLERFRREGVMKKNLYEAPQGAIAVCLPPFYGSVFRPYPSV